MKLLNDRIKDFPKIKIRSLYEYKISISENESHKTNRHSNNEYNERRSKNKKKLSEISKCDSS